MHIEKMTVTTIKNGTGIQTEEKDYKIYNFEDLTPDNAYKICNEKDAFVKLGEYPICGWTVTLNQTMHGIYAWCSMCGLHGPDHWDPYRAAKMFVDKSFTTVAECQEFDPRYFTADIKRFSSRTIDQVKKFLQEGVTK